MIRKIYLSYLAGKVTKFKDSAEELNSKYRGSLEIVNEESRNFLAAVDASLEYAKLFLECYRLVPYNESILLYNKAKQKVREYNALAETVREINVHYFKQKQKMHEANVDEIQKIRQRHLVFQHELETYRNHCSCGNNDAAVERKLKKEQDCLIELAKRWDVKVELDNDGWLIG